MVVDIHPAMASSDRAQAAPDADRGFESCFRDHYGPVLAFAIRRLPDRATAEEVASETFAIAWRRRESIPREPLPWLYGIAYRVIANQRRSLQRRIRLGARLQHEAGSAAGPVEPSDSLHRRESFYRAFRELSEGDREVLRLVAWDGLGAGDASLVLGCSATAFRVRLHRAKRRLAKQLEGSGHSADEGPSWAADPNEEPS